MPVTSAETESANRALKALKTKVRNSMTEGRLTSLSILKIHYSRVVNAFAADNLRRMRMSGIEYKTVPVRAVDMYSTT